MELKCSPCRSKTPIKAISQSGNSKHFEPHTYTKEKVYLLGEKQDNFSFVLAEH